MQEPEKLEPEPKKGVADEYTLNDDSHPGLIKPTEGKTHERASPSDQLNDIIKKHGLNREYAYIPLQILSDPTGTDGAWRGWSCIWLSHLMRETFRTLVSISDDLSTLDPESWEIKLRCLEKLEKRGRYDTKRKEKYWWKTSSEDTRENRLQT